MNQNYTPTILGAAPFSRRRFVTGVASGGVLLSLGINPKRGLAFKAAHAEPQTLHGKMKVVKVKNAHLEPVPRYMQFEGFTHWIKYDDHFYGWLDGDPERAYEIIDGKKTLLNCHFEAYWENGRLCQKGTWIDGLKQGAWQYFHENGTIDARGFQVDNRRVGKWEFYDENGLLLGSPYLSKTDW